MRRAQKSVYQGAMPETVGWLVGAIFTVAALIRVTACTNACVRVSSRLRVFDLIDAFAGGSQSAASGTLIATDSADTVIRFESSCSKNQRATHPFVPIAQPSVRQMRSDVMWIVFLVVLTAWLLTLVVTGVGALIHALITIRERPSSTPSD